MKKLIYLSICLFILNCKKTEIEPSFQSAGIITGQDLRMCACCGGLIIKIDNSEYLINKLPSDFDDGVTKNKIGFPLNVSLDWELKSNCGGNKFIDVNRIKIQ